MHTWTSTRTRTDVPTAGSRTAAAARCAHCQLPLRGPLAVELWRVSQNAEQLLRRRAQLLSELRSAAAPPRPVPTPTPARATEPLPPPVDHPTSEPAYEAPLAHAPGTDSSTQAPRPRREWSHRQVQNALLALGALLLAIAALIFTVVTWGDLEVLGRAGILLAATAAAASAAPAALSRGLDATAEALAALAVAFALIDAEGARRSWPSLEQIDVRVYWAVAAAVIAALCAAYSKAVLLEAPRLSAAVAAQVPGVLVALRVEDPATAAVVLLAQTAVTAYAATRWQRPTILGCLALGAALTGAAGVAFAVSAAYGDEATDFNSALPGALALLAAGAACVWVGWLLRRSLSVVQVSSAAAAAAAVAAVVAVAKPTMDAGTLPAVAAVCALGIVALTLLLPAPWDEGPLALGAAIAPLAVAFEFQSIGEAAVAPLAWLGRTWSQSDLGAAARTVLIPDQAWHGPPSVLVTVGTAALTTALLGIRFRSSLLWRALFASVLVATAVIAPLSLNWPYAVAVAWDLMLVVAATAFAIRTTVSRPVFATAAAGGGGVLLIAHALPWSLANEQMTHVGLAVAVVATAVTAAVRPVFRVPASAICVPAVLGWVFAIARTAGASIEVACFWLALGASLLLLATAVSALREWVPPVDLLTAEVIATGGYCIGLSQTVYEPAWACFALVAGAVAAAAVAVRQDRHHVGAVAAGLAVTAVWSGAIALDASTAEAGLSVVVAACACAGVAWLLRHRAGVYIELVAVAAYGFGVVAATTDQTLLALALLAGAATAAAVALRPDRLFAGAVAAGLSVATAWFGATALGATTAQAGMTVVVTACACAGVAWLLRHRAGELIEAVAAASYAVGVVATYEDMALLAWALLAGAATAAAVSARDDRMHAAAVAAALAVGGAWTSAIALGATISEAGMAVVVTACACAGVAWLLRHRAGEYIEMVAVAAYAVGVVATYEDIALLAWALLAGAATAASVSARDDRMHAAAVAAALAVGGAWTSAIALGATIPEAGMTVVVTACTCAGVAWLLRHRAGEYIEMVAVAAYAVGVVATYEDRAMLSWAFAAGGVTCFAVAVRPDRRAVAYAGSALFTALLWLRLAEADVRAPEPYLLPVALLALGFGHLRRRSDPSIGSWKAYASGLALALEPSLVMTLSDPGLARPLLLGAGAFAVVLFGARERLQAPLVLGGVTLAVDAIVQVAPLAAALPRWVSLAAAGVVLLLVGATYEKRLRDLRNLQAQYEALG